MIPKPTSIRDKEENMKTRKLSRRTAMPAGTAVGVLLLSLGGCDFEVINPGPVQDAFLNDTTALTAVVNGMGRDLAEGMNYVAFQQAPVTRELFPTGGTGQFGFSVKNADGVLAPDEQGAPWDLTQRARWVAEDGLRRFEEVLSPEKYSSSPAIAQSFLWAGYANRTLGENMCEAVIDRGPAEPREVFLTRAQEHFTRAIEVARAAGKPELATAAHAGRAAVRVQLSDWAGARADAAVVPIDFAYNLNYYDVGDREQYNRIVHAGWNAPYKTHSVWGTFYEDYYLETNDARTPWKDTGLSGDGAVNCCGKVPFFRQMKYPKRDAAIRLSSGREMKLIEAEARLREGDWMGAMSLINEMRTAVGVVPWTASSAAEAWTRLKRERGIELWLEGRRLGDLYRWNQENTPGELHPLEVPGEISHLREQDLCFPIPDSERDTNPNLH